MLDRSDPRQVHAERRLQRELVIWLTTVSPAGQPRSSPVWFWWDGQTFLLFSRPRAGKLRGIAANPRVALHLNDDGVGGDIVTIEGVAELRPAVPQEQRAAYAEKYRERIPRLGMTPQQFFEAYSEAIRVTPTRTRVW